MYPVREVVEEIGRQEAKWGIQNHTPCEYMAILTEEVGEAAKECVEITFNGRSTENLRTELIQTAAVAVSFVECLDRGEWEQ